MPITVASGRSRFHQYAKAMVHAVGLQAMLDEEASRIIVAEMPGQLRLAVRVLDLRPRLPTEKRRSKGLRAETTRHRNE